MYFVYTFIDVILRLMKSQQINFYLLAQDLPRVQTYLEKENWQIITKHSGTFETQLSQGIYLTINDFVPESLDKIDLIEMPLVELWQPTLSENTLLRGRMFVIKEFYNETNELITKNTEFIIKTNTLFRWFKREFQKIPFKPYHHFFTSVNTLNWVENGGVLSLNNA